MKLLKTLLPLAGTVATAASIAPLATSCSTNSNTLQYNFSYDYRSIDGLTPYEPKFEPLAQQGKSIDSYKGYYQLYGSHLEKNWAIYADDLLCGTYANLLAIVQDEHCVLETMNGSVKITVNNFELTDESKIYSQVDYSDLGARISWTEEWNLENVWTVELEPGSSHTFHGNLHRKIEYKNIAMCIEDESDDGYKWRSYWCFCDDDRARSNDKKWSISMSESTDIDKTIDSVSFIWDSSNLGVDANFHTIEYMKMHEFEWIDSRDILRDSNGSYSRAGQYVSDGKIIPGCHYMSKNIWFD